MTTYDGKVQPGGDAQTRDVGNARIHKRSVGSMSNNAYLIESDGQALLIDAVERHSGFTATDFVSATALRMEMGTQMSLLHEEFDVLLTPSMPTVAFEAGRIVPDGVGSPDWTSWTPYSYPFNLTGQPAITVPSGFADGLPTGAQFVGARHHDATVLRVAAAYEAAAGFTMLGDRA